MSTSNIDPTQGTHIGDAWDDPTFGSESGHQADEEPTLAPTVGEQPSEDPTAPRPPSA